MSHVYLSGVIGPVAHGALYECKVKTNRVTVFQYATDCTDALTRALTAIGLPESSD